MTRPDLGRLETFLAVVDAGGFSAAARRSGRPQSTISHAVAELERELGVVLFDRSGWKPQLTAAGRSLIEDTRALSRQVDVLMARAHLLSSGVETELSAVVDVMFPLAALSAAATDFQRQYPMTALELNVEALGAVADCILEGESTLGFMASYPKPIEHLQRRSIGKVQLLPVAAPSHPLAKCDRPLLSADLIAHIQLVISDPSEISGVQMFGVLSPRTWRLSDLGVKHAFLLSGLGWGNMPLPSIEQDLKVGHLVRLDVAEQLPNGGQLPIYAAHRRDHPPGPAGRWLIDRFELALSASAVEGG